MVFLLQSSIWRFILLTVAPEIMTLFGIKVFYPKATNYLETIVRQLVDDHAKAKKYGETNFRIIVSIKRKTYS